MRRKIIALVATVALLVSGFVFASAATLGGVSSSLFSASGGVTHPASSRTVSDLVLSTTGDPATVTGLTATITGAALAGLNGQSITVVLFDGSGVQAHTATATLTSGGNLSIGSAATVTLPVAGAPLQSSFASWAVFIAGEQVLGPVSDPTLRVVTTGSGTLTVPVTPIDWTVLLVGSGNADSWIFDVTLTAATTVQQCVVIAVGIDPNVGNNPRTWSVTLDYSAGPFWGTPPNRIENAVVTSTAGTVLTLGGTPGNEQTRRNNPPIEVTVCQDNAPAAPDRPEAYTMSPQGTGTWTSEQACVRRTVTGKGTYPFYFGWSVPLDMTAAYAKLRETDVDAPRSFSVHPNTVSPAFDGGVTNYVVTNMRDTAISGTESRIVELCASRY